MMEEKKRRALQDIRGFAAAGRIHITKHGRKRMNMRGVTYADLRHALTNVTACKAGDDEKWIAESTDLSGDPMSVVIAFWDGLLVVTVF